MMKKVYKILFACLCSFLLISNIEAKSLKQLRDELAKDEARQAELIAEQKAKQKKIDAANKEIGALGKEINSKEDKVEDSKNKIEELETNIKDKRSEIDNLLSFLQVSNGDNIYLEYVFQAKTFTDFIYRSAVVEQLTEYNDNLIDEMYDMIEENKKLQSKLKDEINSAEKSISSLESILKKYGLDMSDIDKNQKDIKAEIKARKVEIAEYEKVYKANKCDENLEITKCVNVPPAGELVRPLKSGRITSNYGMYDPWNNGSWRMHNGMDIGGNPLGTNVYAAAAGKVNRIVVRASCGGNIVYIQHTINGKKLRSLYMHLHSVKVKVGDIVTANTVVGTVGGNESYEHCSTGAHLHFGIMKGWEGTTYYNPRNYVSFPKLGNRFTSRW
jgi:murein DD-endopeptidase MepM/ murein hydrolase activator NlpD